MTSHNGKARVLHVCSDTNIGGAGRYVLALLTQPRILEEFDVAVACPEGDLATALRHAGVPVMLYPGGDASFSWQGLRNLLHVMRAWRPRIVHTHGSLAGRVTAALVGARIVYTKHGLAAAVEQSIQVRSPGALLKRASVGLLADRIVAVSEAVKQSLAAEGAKPDRIRVIPGGVDLSPYADVPPPVPGVIGAFGRLEREKGFDVLISSLVELRNAGRPRDSADACPLPRLLLGGAGTQQQALAEQIRSLGLTEQVTLTGFVPDVPSFLAQIGLFVLPSRSEGLGLVLIEAMAAGRPVVASRVGGVPEVVVDGETGLLVTPENPAALAAAVRRLLDDPVMAVRMGQAGRERVRKLFSSERMAQQTANLYRELISL